MKRYKNMDHVIWEIYNEPYYSKTDKVTWETWAPKARTLIDLIRSFDPVVKTCLVPGVDWATKIELAKDSLKRSNIIYSFHIYPGTYGNQPWTKEKYRSGFGFLVEKGIAPVLVGEWKSTDEASLKTYAPLLASYMKDIGASYTWWCYSPGWGGMISSGLGKPEVRTEHGDWIFNYLNKENNNISPVNQYSVQPKVQKSFASYSAQSNILSCRINSASDLEIQVVDQLGRMLFNTRQKIVEAGIHERNIPLEGYSSGVYFINVCAGSEQAIIKVIIDQ